MRKLSLTLALLSLGCALFANTGTLDHRADTAGYDYEDEQLFLIPHLQADVPQLAGQLVLDAGCGTAAYAKALISKGAHVYACDSHAQRLNNLQIAIATAGIEEKLSLEEGNPVALPYDDLSFDGAVSIQVGDELPRAVHRLVGKDFYIGGLELHMHELARVLKEGATATIVAPASYDVVFTDGTYTDEQVMHHIDKVLFKLAAHTDDSHIHTALSELKEVNRATFAMRNGKLTLVTSANDLTHGEMIWRKEFDQIHTAFYHSEEEYLVALANAGLKCVEVKRPCFFGNVKYNQYKETTQSGLGTAYVNNNPFTIYTVVKQA